MEKETTQYESCLIALHQLLIKAGHGFWANWMNTDLQLWRDSRSVVHHQSAYGGMGSFNDIYISVDERSSLTEQQAVFANRLFDWLRSLAYLLSKSPEKRFDALELFNLCGKYTSILSAFVGGEAASDEIKGYVGGAQTISGLRCSSCGYSEVCLSEVDSFVLEFFLPHLVFKAAEDCQLENLVNDLMPSSVEGFDELRRDVLNGLTASNIKQTSSRWNWNCPSCAKKSTMVYRWKLLSLKPAVFEETR